MKRLRIAHMGAGHTHYAGFLEYTEESPYCEVAGVWDGNKEKAMAWAKAAGTRCFDTYQEILADPTIDGVVITSYPNMHEELIIAAANAGKHIYVEQPLAVSNEAAYRIRDAVKQAGVHFVLSNPVKRPDYMFAKQLMDSGFLGDILNMRVRTLHDNSVLYVNGELPDFSYVYDKTLSGGGAMNNMGCHGVKILRGFLGMPVSVCGLFSSHTDMAKADGIEENAIVIYKFQNGAIGSIETGWVHPRYQGGGFEIHGTRGSVVARHDGIYYRLSDCDKGWVRVSEKLLPSGIPHPMTYWIEHVFHDLPDDEYGIDEAVELTEMICAGYASQGCEVLLKSGGK